MSIKAHLDFVRSICKEYSEFRKMEDDKILFGQQIVLDDIKRQVLKGKSENEVLS